VPDEALTYLLTRMSPASLTISLNGKEKSMDFNPFEI